MSEPPFPHRGPARRLLDLVRHVDLARRRRGLTRRPPRILFDIPNPFSAKVVEPVLAVLRARGVDAKVTGYPQTPGTEGEYLSAFPSLAQHFVRGVSSEWGAWDTEVFLDMPSQPYRRSATRLRMPHGIGEGGTGERPFSLLLAGRVGVHAILCTSQPGCRYLASLEPDLVPDGNLFEIGWPPSDALVAGRWTRDAVLASLGLPPHRRTILIASHWSEHGLLRTFGREIVARVAALPETNVVVTGHHLLWHRTSVRSQVGEDFFTGIEAACAAVPSVRLVRTSDVRRLLVAADVMVVGKSSVAMEFGLLGKPMALFVHPGHVTGNQEYQRVLSAFATTFSTLSELEGVLPGLLNQRPPPEDRQRLVEYGFGYLGGAAERAADVILHLTRTPPGRIIRIAGNRPQDPVPRLADA